MPADSVGAQINDAVEARRKAMVAHGSPFLIVELDFQELVSGPLPVVGRRETT
jgi:hypothetical protein